MNYKQFIQKLEQAAAHTTMYVRRAIGEPFTKKNIPKLVECMSEEEMVEAAQHDKNTFAFDDIGLIKGILWGWDGSSGKSQGGARPESNNIKDFDINDLDKECYDISYDTYKVAEGELLWDISSVGVYVGDYKVITVLPGQGVVVIPFNPDMYLKRGKLQYIQYVEEAEPKKEKHTPAQKVKIGDVIRTDEYPHLGSGSENTLRYRSDKYYVVIILDENEHRYNIGISLYNGGPCIGWIRI